MANSSTTQISTKSLQITPLNHNYKPNFKGVGMSPEQFIKNNVVNALLTDGYSAEQAEQGGGRGYFVLPALIEADNQAQKHL